ncbi:tetratricopeptide repeat protein [Spirosoma utsteinense]|uniref:Tetratricopeptide (TPR) repeat protein n=1 Tax=Spirosoma utsteinense TaxID=2585773 RepID=A0ABR6W1I1_9BACT|nr:tetratricopeptide repeat protein [Spirosoma utsteinense]MBC3784681.1 tetratricopeptide (TPR) repeat protein [Spirosoma utsteinense]MBC3789565.1 tetratricopeptide (TPR) repeat protein [Spirosoma utsteinense]
MKTHINCLLLTALVGTALAQTPAPDAATLMNLGRFDEATQLLTHNARQNPSMQAYFDAGYGYLRAGQPDSARIWFTKGVPMDEKRVPLNQTGVAISYLVENNTASAEPELAAVSKKSKGKNATILYRIGEAYTGYLTPDSGSIKPRFPNAVNATKAIDYLNQAAGRDKKNPAIQLILGDAHYLNRDAGTAVTRYESAIEQGMDPARAYQRIGDIYWQGRNLNLAVENYRKAIEANPSYAPAYRQLSELYFLVNRYKEAATYSDQYVRVSSDRRPETLLRQAQFHFLAKEYQRAVNLIDSNRTVLAQNPIVYRIQGWAYSGLKQPQKAIENISTFLDKAPDKVMYDDYKYLGQAYLAIENPGSDSLKAISDSLGITYLEKAAPFDTTENLYGDIAKYYYRSKKHEQAVATLDSAASHGHKADVQDLFRYGMSNYTLGFQRDSLGKLVRDTTRFALADSALALAQQASPDYAPTILYRAKANYYAYPPEEAVRKGEAKPYFEQFIGLVEGKEEERNRYKKDLILAFKYLISYHELVSKDMAARAEWLKKGLALFPQNKDLAKIATSEDDEQQ